MKCPVCDGRGYTLKQRFVGAGVVTDKPRCNHCQGTGEIQEGDWWKMRSLVDGDYVEAVCFMDFSSDLDWDSWEPLYRMERVK